MKAWQAKEPLLIFLGDHKKEGLEPPIHILPAQPHTGLQLHEPYKLASAPLAPPAPPTPIFQISSFLEVYLHAAKFCRSP